MQTELSNPITVQMRLPKPVFDRMREESEADMIPMTLLVRRCVIRNYGGDTVLPEDSTERTETSETVHEAQGGGNG